MGRVFAQKRTAVATSLTHNKLAGVARGPGYASRRAPPSGVRPAGVPGPSTGLEPGRIGPAATKNRSKPPWHAGRARTPEGVSPARPARSRDEARARAPSG